MGNTDYTRPDLTILVMVFNRLPFLDSDDVPTQDTVKDFIFEVMHELEPCFQIGADNVGLEQYYTYTQQSIIADVVAVYILMYQAATNAQGTPGSAPTTRYLKRAKAGSAETEWGQFSTKDGVGLFITADGLIDRYKKSAARKARNLGCILDICDDCTAQDPAYQGVYPILMIENCGCS